MGIILRGGKIITDKESSDSDIRIVGEKIIAIGNNLYQNGDEVIDVSGCYLIPGGIDTHTHFDLDVGKTITADNFLTGTKAAIVGGTTTVLDYATQNKGETLKEALNNQFNKTENGCYCDYGFHMGITDWNDVTSKEMSDMVKSGVSSFKLYMAYKNTLQVDDGVIYQALKRCKEVGGLIGFHCENGHIIDVLVENARKNNEFIPLYHALTRPASLEKEAITRLLQISEMLDVNVNIVHLSSYEGLIGILEAKRRGAKVTVETCPQYLLLDDSLYGNKNDNSFEGAKYVMSPPLRKNKDQVALWNAIKTGVITTIGTDHCSFNYHGQKDIGINDFSSIPNGAPGVEHRMALMYTYGVISEKINLNQFVALTSTNAAKLFGLYPNKGTIAVGSDADILVWDPNTETVINALNQVQNVDYTPYEGFKIKGKILHVLLRGNKVVFNSELNTNEPLGEFLHRKPYLERY